MINTTTVIFDSGIEFDKPKICNNCKNFRPIYHRFEGGVSASPKCSYYKRIVGTDLVTGEPIIKGTFLNCYKARKREKLCGLEGRWFEQKIKEVVNS